MLQVIREKTSGWFAAIILGLIIFAMAFFGIESYFQSNVETYAARIATPPSWWASAPDNALVRKLFWEEHDVDANEFRERFDRYRQETRLQQGERYDAEQVERIETKRDVLDSLIDRRVLELAAQRQGVRISEQQVEKAILEIDGLTGEDGKFIGVDAYKIWLQSRGQTHESLKALVAQDLLASALVSGVRDSALATSAELESFLKLQQQTRDIRFVALPVPTLSTPEPDDAALQAWYTANAAQFRTPETAQIAYVEVDASSLSVEAAPSEADLRQRYEDEKSRFGSAEERDAAHILIAVAKDADEAAVAAAQAKADEVLAKARVEDADFAALAAEFSDDVGSKDMGGDLGAIGRDIYPKPFEDAVFALAEGGISDPVRTDEGFHIIKLTRLVAGSEQPFEAVRDQLLTEVLDAERERLFSEVSGKLTDAVLLDPTSLEAAARAVGLEVQTSVVFTRTAGEGIASIDAVRKAAFANSQLLDRQVSDPVEIGPNHIAVIQVTEHTPAATRPLDEVRAEATAGWQADELASLGKAAADAALARVVGGESFEDVAASAGTTVTDANRVPRTASVPDAAVVRTAFRLRAGTEEAAAEPGVADLGGGRFALVVASAAYDGDVSTLDEETRGLLRQQLASMRGELEARAYIKALRAQYRIDVAEDRL